MTAPLTSARLLGAAFLTRLARPRRLTLPLGAALLLSAAVVLTALQAHPNGAAFVLATAVRDLHFGFLLPFVSLYYAMAVVGDEVDRGTLTWILLRPVPRGAFLAGRTAAAAVLAFLVQVPALVTLAWAAYYLDVDVGALDVPRHLAVTALGTAAYVSLYLLISLVFRRGFLVGLLHIGLVELVVGLVPGRIGYLAIRAHLANLLELRSTGVGLIQEALYSPVDTGDSLGFLLVLTALAFWAAVLVFRGKEMVAERTSEEA